MQEHAPASRCRLHLDAGEVPALFASLPVRVGKVVTKGDKTSGIDPDRNQICLVKAPKMSNGCIYNLSIAKYAALGGSRVRFESIVSLKLLLGIASSRI